MLRRIAKVLCLVIALGLAASPAFAQARSSSADITGVVRDPGRSVVRGATVKATNIATGLTRSAISDTNDRAKVSREEDSVTRQITNGHANESECATRIGGVEAERSRRQLSCSPTSARPRWPGTAQCLSTRAPRLPAGWQRCCSTLPTTDFESFCVSWRATA